MQRCVRYRLALLNDELAFRIDEYLTEIIFVFWKQY